MRKRVPIVDPIEVTVWTISKDYFNDGINYDVSIIELGSKMYMRNTSSRNNFHKLNISIEDIPVYNIRGKKIPKIFFSYHKCNEYMKNGLSTTVNCFIETIPPFSVITTNDSTLLDPKQNKFRKLLGQRILKSDDYMDFACNTIKEYFTISKSNDILSRSDDSLVLRCTLVRDHNELFKNATSIYDFFHLQETQMR